MQNNKRLAKNTFLLYIRMIIILLISLYTSRVLLTVLGVDDFGIYNVVAGVIVLFSFLTNAMTSSTQRFLNFNIGLGYEEKITTVFSTSILTHLIIFLLVLFLGETIGLWFLITQLNIPVERATAAFWVYQLSLLSTVVNIMIIPYRAAIIATEKMSIFAYLTILESFLKLIAVLFLPYIFADRLIIYSVFLTIISILVFFLHIYICQKRFPFTRFCFIWDKNQFKEQMSFSGWYLFGGISLVGSKQGINILINIFYNVSVNAAVGIANQVRGAIYSFVSSFQTAFNPQLVKLYASKDDEGLMDLIYQSSKFSYYLLFVLSLPVFLYCDQLLSIWLVNVPQYSVAFTRMVIISSFIEALSAPLWTVIGAIGKVKKYQIGVSVILLLNIPFVFFALKIGFDPIYAYIINVVLDLIAFVFRFLYSQRFVNLNFKSYCNYVISPCLLTTIFAVFISYVIYSDTLSFLILSIHLCLTVLLTLISIFVLGLRKNERDFIIKYIFNLIAK